MEGINFGKFTKLAEIGSTISSTITKAIQKGCCAVEKLKLQTQSKCKSHINSTAKSASFKSISLMKEIDEIKLQITIIRSCYDLETDFDLIDSYIMQLGALEHRYDFLIKQAKASGIVAFEQALSPAVVSSAVASPAVVCGEN